MEPYAELISKKLEEAETEINIEIRSHNNKQNRDIRQQILDIDKYLNIYSESVDSLQKHITKINTIREEYEQRSAVTFGSSENKTVGLSSLMNIFFR